MKENPLFFENGKYRLFGVLHSATEPMKKEGFVFCAPFAEEKLWAHRVIVNFARELAVRGYPVLRFDYMGNGDSEGNFEESTLDTMLSDTACAMSKLRESVHEIKSISLLGLRLGASIAAITSGKLAGVNRLILWEPIINGTSYMREMLRINLSTQAAVNKKILNNTDALIKMMQDGKTVNVDGYEMTWHLYEQIARLNLLEISNNKDCRALIIQISKNDDSVSPLLSKLKEIYPHRCFIVSVEEPFWKEIRHYYSRANNLFQITLRWLKDNEN